jgi:hypothetical protein
MSGLAESMGARAGENERTARWAIRLGMRAKFGNVRASVAIGRKAENICSF